MEHFRNWLISILKIRSNTIKKKRKKNEDLKYKVQNETIQHILNLIESDNIAIPEIQRPFVWESKKVRNLIDSIYNGFPIGYIVLWSGDNINVKNLETSIGKAVVIDGQQRILALETALEGEEILDKKYTPIRFKIDFNPQAKNQDSFMIQNAATKKDPAWINDISRLFDPDYSEIDILDDYLKDNPEADRKEVFEKIKKLIQIKSNTIGIIMLDNSLTLDEVTEIFNRLNSTGSSLRTVDFAMSKLEATEEFEGPVLKAAIDRFSHLLINRETIDFYRLDEKEDILEGTDFKKYIREYEHLKSEPIYKPDYSDILRVVFLYKFCRGKMQDLVRLLSGRDFEKKIYKKEIAEDTFARLKEGVLDFLNPYNFKEFLLTLSTAGFKTFKQFRSKMALDYCYALYLYLKKTKKLSNQDLRRYVQKWFVLSSLTGRYSSSSESDMDADFKLLKKHGIEKMLENSEKALLSETFWNINLPESLNTFQANNAYFNIYKAALAYNHTHSLFSNIPNEDLIKDFGDMHHIFPKSYLKKKGMEQSQYNQIANMTPADKNINRAIGEMPPNEYFPKVLKGIDSGESTIGNLSSLNDYYENLKDNAIPENIKDMDYKNYEEFLELRRNKMAEIIKDYYYSL